MEALKSIKLGDFVLKIFMDEDSPNPRHFCSISKMICFHKRYSLGDVNTNDYKHSDYTSWNDMRGDILRRENVRFIKPLFMYDHGNVSISMSDFADPWDSGQIGFIYVTEEDAEGIADDRLFFIVQNEIDEYNAWLNGDVYRFTIYEEQTCDLGCAHLQFVDGCGGYFDMDDCIAEGEAQLTYYKETGVLS